MTTTAEALARVGALNKVNEMYPGLPPATAAQIAHWITEGQPPVAMTPARLDAAGRKLAAIQGKTGPLTPAELAQCVGVATQVIEAYLS